MNSLELFAGAGGAALGIRRAGVTALACVEWDADAAATLSANGFPAVHGDVRSVDYTDLPHVDLLWASPPCQAWSGLGKRKGADRGDRTASESGAARDGGYRATVVSLEPPCNLRRPGRVQFRDRGLVQGGQELID